jgi:hypothetical protein
MRTGKGRSASAIMNPEHVAIAVFYVRSQRAIAHSAQEVHSVGVPVPTHALVGLYHDELDLGWNKHVGMGCSVNQIEGPMTLKLTAA